MLKVRLARSCAIFLVFVLGASAARATDEKALLAAILEFPQEDTPRLMYADWLDEHNRPKLATFIREDVAHARAGDFMSWTGRRALLIPAEIETLGQSGVDTLNHYGVKVEWSRGLPEAVILYPSALSDDALRVAVDKLPGVRSLEFLLIGMNGPGVDEPNRQERYKKFLTQVAKLKTLRTVRSLRMFNEVSGTQFGLSEADFEEVLSHGERVEKLQLEGGATRPAIEALARSRMHTRLKALALQPAEPGALASLMESDRFRNLEALHLVTYEVDLRPFHDLSHFPALGELHVKFINRQGDAYVPAPNTLRNFVASRGFIQLRRLLLPTHGALGAEFEPTYAESLIATRTGHQLTDLRFRNYAEGLVLAPSNTALKAQLAANHLAAKERPCFHFLELFN